MMKYDVLRKKFVTKRFWELDEVLVTESFDEAQKVMTEIRNFKILPFTLLENGNRYQMRIKAELSKASLPINLQSGLFVSPSWDFETDWYILDFNH